MTDSVYGHQSREGNVTIHNNDDNLALFYTTDNSDPTTESTRYTVPFATAGPVVIKAITVNLKEKTQSTATAERFDVIKKDWKVLNIKTSEATKAANALVIDLGKTENVSGFSYVPDQNRWSTGIIYKYAFYVSSNNKQWTKVSSGEFSNIKNSPTLRDKTFTPIKARYIKLVALANTEGDHVAGYAEFDLITK